MNTKPLRKTKQIGFRLTPESEIQFKKIMESETEITGIAVNRSQLFEKLIRQEFEKRQLSM